MPRKTLHLMTLCLLLGVTVVEPVSAQEAEPEAEPRYVILDCMKSTSSDYQAVEMELWKPVHQELISQGRKLQWAFYWVMFGDRSECDYYTANVVTQSQLNGPGDFQAVFETVHAGKDVDEMMARTSAAREMVWSQLWLIHDMVQPNDFSYVQVNQMDADDSDAYISMEREVYRPVHAALVKDSVTAGWGLYQLMSPHGSSIGYNFGTVDFLKSLGGIDFGSYMQKAHPDKDVAALNEQTGEVRDMVRSEVWMLLDRADPSE